MCAGPNLRQRQKLAQINNSAGSQIQFAISLRAITIKFIDCNQSKSLIKPLVQILGIWIIKLKTSTSTKTRKEVVLPAKGGPAVYKSDFPEQVVHREVLSGRRLDRDCWCFAVAPRAGIGAPAQLAGRRCLRCGSGRRCLRWRNRHKVPEVRVMRQATGEDANV